jgi:hypothetical protein
MTACLCGDFAKKWPGKQNIRRAKSALLGGGECLQLRVMCRLQALTSTQR